MLVLSRQQNEEIVVSVPPSTEAREIRVAVMQIDRHKVRIGFHADRAVTIDRKEIVEAKARKGSAA